MGPWGTPKGIEICQDKIFKPCHKACVYCVIFESNHESTLTLVLKFYFSLSNKILWSKVSNAATTHFTEY